MKLKIEVYILNRAVFYFLGISVLFFNACLSSKKDENSFVSIDIEKVIQNIQNLPMSKFVNNLEYIPLELTEESSIGQDLKLYLTDNYIIVRNYSKGVTSLLLLFDRKTGKFIRFLGKLGRGPGEYSHPLDCFYNPYNNKLYTFAGMRNSIKVYDLEGKLYDSFETPKYNEPTIKNGYIRPSLEAFLNSDTFIGYFENLTGTIKRRITIFTKSQELKSFPNNEAIIPDGSGMQYVFTNQSPIFFSWNETISFKERSNDTLFGINRNNMFPRIILKSGEYKEPYKMTRNEAIAQINDPVYYFNVLNIFENSRYIFCEISFKKNRLVPGKLETYLLIFDKKTKQTSVSQSPTNNLASIADDIDGFMPFSPRQVTEKNEIIGFLRANDIIKWLKENPNKSKSLMLNFRWLKNLNELDNPIIVIGKCKE